MNPNLTSPTLSITSPLTLYKSSNKLPRFSTANDYNINIRWVYQRTSNKDCAYPIVLTATPSILAEVVSDDVDSNLRSALSKYSTVFIGLFSSRANSSN